MAAALYLRLSREDGDRNESESIAAQRLLLSDYCRTNAIDIYEVYIDDGYSGLHFDRPAFIRMLDDARQKCFDTIVTKDLSRLGRDYIQTGEYVEKIFPLLGVRYIAIGDGIDTAENGGINDFFPFQAVFNDMYAKDISKKVRASLTARRKAGMFIGSGAPYGYKKSESSHSVLEPNPPYDEVVRRIYDEYAAGNSMRAIARNLTRDKIATPSCVKSENGGGSKAWNDTMLRRILTNPTYCGDLTQRFVTTLNYKVKKRRVLPAGERITVPDTHEPLVSRALFETVRGRIDKQRTVKG